MDAFPNTNMDKFSKRLACSSSVALPAMATIEVEKHPKSLRIFTTTYNMARTPVDFNCAELLPKPYEYDLIAIGFQEASMRE